MLPQLSNSVHTSNWGSLTNEWELLCELRGAYSMDSMKILN